eukprot:g83480.t1
MTAEGHVVAGVRGLLSADMLAVSSSKDCCLLADVLAVSSSKDCCLLADVLAVSSSKDHYVMVAGAV